MDSILLVGTEPLTHASHRIQEAAERMNSAAASIDNSLRQHQQWMDEWLNRLQEVIQSKTE